MANFISFIKGQFTDLPLATADLTGKVFIVTGSNVGLGYEAVKHLAKMKPAKLILAVRSLDKGDQAVENIKKDTGFENLEVWHLDLANFANTIAFAKRCEENLDRLDCIIENAGVWTLNWAVTEDGYENTLQTNYLSTGLLAILLLPLLRKTVQTYGIKPRLVIVASEVHAWCKFPEQDDPSPVAALNDQSRHLPSDRYYVSKLLDVLLTRELAEKLKASNLPEDKEISVNCVNPGWCHSELSREYKSLGLQIIKTAIARTTEEGSRTYLMNAVGDIKDAHGEYFSNCEVTPPSDLVLSSKGQKIQKRVWEEMWEILSKYAPQINDILQ